MASSHDSFLSSLPAYGIDAFCIIDVGAKDQLEHIPLLDPITRMIAFEPQPDEAERLRKKYQAHRFANLQIRQEALADKPGEQVFHITHHSSMSSLLEGDLDNYEQFFGKNKDFNRWKKSISPAEKIPVKLETLNRIIDTEGVAYIDYLKLDTQGYELKILEGARELLLSYKIGVIKTEIAFVSTYHDQPLFSDIDLFLRNCGYVLVDAIFYTPGYTPSLTARALAENPYRGPSGDALYMPAPDYLATQPAKAISVSMVLASMGYVSMASSLLTKAGVNEKTKETWLKLFHQKPFAARFKHFLKNHLPPSIFYYIRKIFKY